MTLPVALDMYNWVGLVTARIRCKDEDFLAFYQVWKRCDVYAVPCGIIRFEPYPKQRAATFHGLVDKNPYPDLPLLKSMLYLYLEEHQGIDVLECHVPSGNRGVERLVKQVMTYEKLAKNGDKIYLIRR